MLTKLQIQNYKALRDVTLDLTPFHVLIGPNDSGKTSILEAICALSRSVEHRTANQVFPSAWQGHELVWQAKSDLQIQLSACFDTSKGSHEYSLSFSTAPSGRTLRVAQETVDRNAKFFVGGGRGHPFTIVWHQIQNGATGGSEPERKMAAMIADALKGVQYYHWDSSFLALPNAPDSSRPFRMEQSGFGLARCLDDLLGFDRDLFMEMEKRFQDIFPDIKSIKMIPEPGYKETHKNFDDVSTIEQADGKGLYFEFHTGGPPVSARQVSDGVLLVLAYLAILYQPEPPRLLLIEEPENGIHPNRLKDILSILRELVAEQSHTQLVMTTHSPYVVDLFKPEEVTLCQKQADGSVAVRRLSESKTVREQLDVFTLGEIWTAEGDDALLSPIVPEGEPQG